MTTTQAYTQYIQDNLERMSEGWIPVCFEEFTESEECEHYVDDPPPSPAEEDSDWHLAGKVGVDAGMLMVSDPCYLRGEWMGEGEEKPNIARGFRHTDGRVFYCVMHGQAPCESAIGFPTFAVPLEALGGMDVNTAVDKGILKEMGRPDPSGEFSYQGCCEATMADEQCGQLNYRRGHPGAGVVFSSGMGDGVYNVYVRYADMGDWGRRVAEARIVMIGKDEEEETKKFMEEVARNSQANLQRALES